MEPGYNIEHYTLIEPIGQGGQAIVWSANDERLKRMVAIKMIKPRSEGSPDSTVPGDEVAQRFADEARIIADLEHPAILPIYTFGNDGGVLYIVMRYMAGGTLTRRVQNGPFDLRDTIRLATPLADALDLAHHRKIIHRDIKSENILLDARSNAYLSDFGLSVTLGDTTSPGAGTLAYMSPEQLMGDPINERSDLYAFAMLMYEMLVGHLPSINGQPWNIQQVMAAAQLPIPEPMSIAVADVLRRALALEPGQRHASANEIITALVAVEAASITPANVVPAEQIAPSTDPAVLALRKAQSLFDTALDDWADGAGRFRFYAEDFKFVEAYFVDHEFWHLTLEDATRRLMLRAALEHGHAVQTWWDALTDPAERRAIALQTLGSELATARDRALTYLAGLPESDPPAIPTHVAALLRAEPDPSVRRTGIAVLASRGSSAPDWQPFAFSESIDLTLAALATDDPDPILATQAAEALARLQAGKAVEQIGHQASAGHSGAQRALADIRRLAPNLPTGIPAQARRRAWATVSVRQLFAPGLLGRYLAAAVGFALGWGIVQYVQYKGRDLLPLQAVGNAAASGVLYSLLVALGVLLAAEPANRLRVWTKPSRIGLSWLLGMALTLMAFLVLRRFYYFNTDPPDAVWMLLASAAFAGGFSISSGLTRNISLRAIGGTFGILLGIYFSWQWYSNGNAADPLIYFGQDSQALILSLVIAVSTGVLSFLPEIAAQLLRKSTQQSNTVDRNA